MADSKLVAEADRKEIAGSVEPPIVARLVVEIRSDGTRTIARGALEDRLTGETISVHTEGSTPAMLALSLLGSLQKLPLFNSINAARAVAQQVLKAILPGRKS